MFDEKTILARLQNGEDVQVIADEMTKLINEANKIFNEQRANEIQKQKELQDILDLLADWLGDYYKADAAAVKKELKADTIIEFIDSCREYADTLNNWVKKAPVGTKTIKPKKLDVDDAITQFLDKMGW